MDFKDLVKYIKDDGCRVRIYDDRELIHGAQGTFHTTKHGPIISLATQRTPKKKRVEYLLHEYGHYLQWKEGFDTTIDGICDAYDIWDNWVDEKIELTELEWKVARNSMLAIEGDAEYRALKWGNELGVKHFHAEHHLKGAYSYILAIKWGWLYRSQFVQCPKRKKLEARVLTKKQLFAPLTRKEKRILKNYEGRG